MVEVSKVAPKGIAAFLIHLLVGSRNKKLISATALLIITFLLYVRARSAPLDPLKPERKKSKGGKGLVDGIFFNRIKELLRIVIPSWRCGEFRDLILLTVFLVMRTFLSIYLASVNGRIVKAIINRDLSLFIKRILGLGLVSIPASFVNSFLDFLNKRLALSFKRRLTNHFHGIYLRDMIFYQLGNLDSRISNPDQRLTADIDKWSQSLSTIYSNFTKPFLDIVLFSKKLSELVGWSGPGVVIAWYLLSGIVLKVVSPPFGLLTANEQRLEGQYRSTQTDLVHHAEQIAFYRGNQWQKTRINAVFNKFIKHSEGIMNKKLYMGVFDSMLVKYGAFMVGYGVLGIPVFGSAAQQYNTNVGSSSNITRDYIRNSSLLINLAKAIGKLVISYKEIQHLAGFTTLIHEMKTVLNDLEKGKFVRRQVNRGEQAIALTNINSLSRGTTIETENQIDLIKVPIISPNGDLLVAEISFKVEIGMHTVITGPNGCGKSSLFRILSGLWPLAGGVLKRPHMDKLFYIPQRPYLPRGTLRDQIIYPHENSVKRRTDPQLEELLAWVKLQYLVDRGQSLDTVNDWNDKLSGGQKQRLAMARLFYHRPLFAILDQCTSAMSMDVEAELYTRAKQLEITLFTVSHRTSLYKFHEYMLKFDGLGGYEMNKME